jgi:hypothetical protein
MAAALGVPAATYFIYCFFNLLNPAISFLFSVAGIGNVKVETMTISSGKDASVPEPEPRAEAGR